MSKDKIDLTIREAPAIDPGKVTKNSDGFARREFFVRLPKEAVADDLKEPGIWRKVQATPNALRRHDDVYVVAFDETWVAEAIVADANNTQVVIAKPRITQFPERYEKLFEDDVYRVQWMGGGYIVERKADGRHMTKPVPNAQIAATQLIGLHPQRVGA